MLPVARRDAIKEMLFEKKSLSIAEMSETFQVTDETIRRDLKLLEGEGFLVKTHGGAFIQNGVENDINIALRQSAFLESKEKIARLSAVFVHHGDSIFLDCSTTSYHVAQAVKNMRITIITNSMLITHLLCNCENIRLIVIGGIFNRKNQCNVGKSALQTLNNYFADIAFISCRSVSMEYGITDSNEAIAEVRSLILERANRVYLLCDYSKFDNTSFVSVGSFDSITGLVTDRELSPQWMEFLKEKKVAAYFPE